MLPRRKCFHFAAKQIYTKDPVHNITIWKTFLQKDSQEKKKLETKLRNLNFTKGANINLFQNTSRNTLKELYQLQGENTNAVDAIAIYHVVTSLSKNVKSKAKILQSKGNKSLESLLELVEIKLSGNPMFVNASRFHDKFTSTLPSKTGE